LEQWILEVSKDLKVLILKPIHKLSGRVPGIKRTAKQINKKRPSYHLLIAGTSRKHVTVQISEVKLQ
jgi:hypothetical protein